MGEGGCCSEKPNDLVGTWSWFGFGIEGSVSCLFLEKGWGGGSGGWWIWQLSKPWKLKLHYPRIRHRQGVKRPSKVELKMSSIIFRIQYENFSLIDYRGNALPIIYNKAYIEFKKLVSLLNIFNFLIKKNYDALHLREGSLIKMIKLRKILFW